MSEKDQKKPKLEGVERIGRFGRFWLPLESFYTAFRFGRNFTKGGEKRRLEMSQRTASRLRNLREGCAKALFKPPIWESIEEMEEGWGIDDSNRTQTIKGMAKVRIVYAVLSVLTIAYIVTQIPETFFRLVMTISLVVTLAFLMLQFAILSWRIHCLKNRVCPNFMMYMRGK